MNATTFKAKQRIRGVQLADDYQLILRNFRKERRNSLEQVRELCLLVYFLRTHVVQRDVQAENPSSWVEKAVAEVIPSTGGGQIVVGRARRGRPPKMELEDRIKIARMIGEGRVSQNMVGKVWRIAVGGEELSKSAARRYLLEAMMFVFADTARLLLYTRDIFLKADSTTYVIQRDLFGIRIGGVVFRLKESSLCADLRS
jgi:hypothetical protein